MNGHYAVGDIVLDHWTLEKMIGSGSFGKVYEAVRTDYGHTYKAAIKIITVPQSQSEIDSIRSEGLDAETVTNYFDSFVDELIQEFKLMADLKGNSNIVSYEDHRVIKHEDQIGWDIIIRMELLTPLLEYQKDHLMNKQDVIRMGVDICKALELCLKYNIIHRDIKPENIFVSKMGDFKLGDFGIARTVEKTTGGLSKKGTFTYMAPEVFLGKPYLFDVDIYSLGIVLYRSLNGNRTPFLPPYPNPITHSDRENALTQRMRGDAIPAPANADQALADVVLRACAYQPGARFRSPTHMRQALEALQDKSIGMFLEEPELLPTELINRTANEMVTEPTAEKQMTATKEPVRKNQSYDKKKLPVLIGAAAVALIGGVLLFSNGGKTEESVINVQTQEWSEWMEELPDFVSTSEYIIDTKKMYRSAEAIVHNEEQADAGVLCYTVQGEFGEWSDWQEDEIVATDGIQVETKTTYQYRKLRSRTNYKQDNRVLGGRVTTTSYYWSEWMDSSTPVTANSSTEVRSSVLYRSRERSKTYYYCQENAWSEANEEPIYPDEKTVVNVYNVYRYALAQEEVDEQGSMSNFVKPQIDAGVRYADIFESDWYAPAKNNSIVMALELKAMDTTPYMCFRPNDSVTVAELLKAATVIRRSYYDQPGQLVEGENWEDVYAEYAVSHNIISKNMLSDLNREATRQDAAYILYASLPEEELLPINEVSVITDMEKVSLYYERVYRFAQAGIVAWPTPEYSFNPNRLVTRAEVAVMINTLVHPELRNGS